MQFAFYCPINVNYVGRTGESRNEDNGNKPIIEKWKVFQLHAWLSFYENFCNFFILYHTLFSNDFLR
jgi:hypothetical protein